MQVEENGVSGQPTGMHEAGVSLGSAPRLSTTDQTIRKQDVSQAQLNHLGATQNLRQGEGTSTVQVVPLEPWNIAALAKPDMVIADDEWNDWGIPDTDYLCQCARDIGMILDEEPVLNKPSNNVIARDHPAS